MSRKPEDAAPAEIDDSDLDNVAAGDNAHGSRLTGIRSHSPIKAVSPHGSSQEAVSPRDAASGMATGKR
ncbi:MAG: hypothetical protein AAGK00_17195 [Pseudomonadota bacterium]